MWTLEITSLAKRWSAAESLSGAQNNASGTQYLRQASTASKMYLEIPYVFH